jgi:hypothetical protein
MCDGYGRQSGHLSSKRTGDEPTLGWCAGGDVCNCLPARRHTCTDRRPQAVPTRWTALRSALQCHEAVVQTLRLLLRLPCLERAPDSVSDLPARARSEHVSGNRSNANLHSAQDPRNMGRRIALLARPLPEARPKPERVALRDESPPEREERLGGQDHLAGRSDDPGSRARLDRRPSRRAIALDHDRWHLHRPEHGAVARPGEAEPPRCAQQAVHP